MVTTETNRPIPSATRVALRRSWIGVQLFSDGVKLLLFSLYLMSIAMVVAAFGAVLGLGIALAIRPDSPSLWVPLGIGAATFLAVCGGLAWLYLSEAGDEWNDYVDWQRQRWTSASIQAPGFAGLPRRRPPAPRSLARIETKVEERVEDAWLGPLRARPIAPAVRSLTFPTHRSYGVVYHRSRRDYWGGRGEWWPGAWERFLAKLSNGEPAFPPAARGTVSVPVGVQLRLWSSQKDHDGKHLPAELDVLRTFAPDTFDSLAVLWPSDADQLAHIAHLTELRELVLLSRFGDGGLTDLGSLESLRSLDLAYNKTLSDDGVAKLLARNARLAYIYLSGTGITDASLRLIAPRTIKILKLDSTAVTDEGLATLSLQANLAHLSLRKTAITDAALRGVGASWPSLEALQLEGTGVTDRGLAAVDAAPRLRWLDVSETSVSAETLDAATFGRVENLNVSHTALSDAGLRRIAALPPLQRLSLWDTAVTDAGLEALHGHPTLAALSLSGDEFTARGLLALLESLPSIWEVNFGMHRAVSVERIETLKAELRSGVVEGSW